MTQSRRSHQIIALDDGHYFYDMGDCVGNLNGFCPLLCTYADMMVHATVVLKKSAFCSSIEGFGK